MGVNTLPSRTNVHLMLTWLPYTEEEEDEQDEREAEDAAAEVKPGSKDAA